MASEIVAITFFFITMIVLIVNFYKTRHNERMALISSGRTARIFDGDDTESNRSLKFGLFLLSIGFGLLIGLFFDNIFNSEPAGVFISIFICGGLSLIYYHFYLNTKSKNNQKEDDEIV